MKYSYCIDAIKQKERATDIEKDDEFIMYLHIRIYVYR